MKMITIAIDGFSSCGRKHHGQDLARGDRLHLHRQWRHCNRAVTLYCLENGLFLADGQIDTARLEREMDSIHISFRLNPQTGRPDTYLNGQNVEDRIRTMEVSARVSPVVCPALRAPGPRRPGNRRWAREKGIVMDGRDIGTTVSPTPS